MLRTKLKNICFASLLIGSIALINITACHNDETILPRGWDQICTFTQDSSILGHYVDHLTAGRVYLIRCQVTEEYTWDFAVLQAWLRRFTGFSVFLIVDCNNRGTISLPWPMKAKGLVGLKVSQCKLKDKYADVMNQDISTFPDQLRVLDMRNSVWLSESAAFESMIRPENLLNMSADYDCGQDSTLEYMVMSNVTDMLRTHAETSVNSGADKATEHSVIQGENIPGVFKSTSSLGAFPSDSMKFENSDASNNFKDMLNKLSQSSNISDGIAVSLKKPSQAEVTNLKSSSQAAYEQLLTNIQSMQHTCVFKKLKVLDESCPTVMSAHHFSIMVQSGSYPVLRTMNYSLSGLPDIPLELKNSRVYFPKLSYLDLSKNRIRYVNISKVLNMPGSNHLSLDLRYNHISHIDLKTLQSWARIRDFYIDIRFNPIVCGCHMNDLLVAMKNPSFFNETLTPYKYIKEMRCYSPKSLEGKRLSSVELTCSDRISNSLAAENLSSTSLSQTNMTVLVVFSSLAAIVLAVVVFFVLISFMKYGPPDVKDDIDKDVHQTQNQLVDVECGHPAENLSSEYKYTNV